MLQSQNSSMVYVGHSACVLVAYLLLSPVLTDLLQNIYYALYYFLTWFSLLLTSLMRPSNSVYCPENNLTLKKAWSYVPTYLH